MSDQAQASSSVSTLHAGGWRLPASGQRPNRLEVILLLGILLLAAGLRLYHLDYKSLGLEELIYLQLAQPGSFSDPAALAGAAHPPLYLLLMRLLSDVSRADGLLRLPALLAGVGAVAALWALGRSLLTPLSGLLAALMLAMSALHIEISQEVHSYALLGLLSTLLFWSLVRAARREMVGVGVSSQEPGGTDRNSEEPLDLPDRLMRGLAVGPSAPVITWLAAWWPFIVTATLALYTNYNAIPPVVLSLLVFPCLLLAVAPGPLVALWQDPARRRAWLHLLAALTLAGLLFLPQLITGLASGASGLAVSTVAFRTGLVDMLVIFVSNRLPWNLDPLFVSTMLLLALAGLAWLFWRRRAAAMALTLWIALPLLVWHASSADFRTGPQQLVWVQPVFLLAAAVGVTAVAQLAAWLALWLAPSKASYAVLASVLVLVAFLLAFAKGSADPLQAGYRSPKQDWKGLAAMLQQVPTPNDAVVILPSAAPLQWYYRGHAQTPVSDLVTELELLCRYNAAVFVASAADNGDLSSNEASFLQENYIQVPLKDLALYYRNCQPDVWYGAGAEALFPLSRQPGLHFPESRRAQTEFAELAAQARPTPAARPAPAATVPAAQPAPTAPAAAVATPVASPTSAPEPLDIVADLGATLVSLAEAAPDDPQAQLRLGAFALQQRESPQQAGAYFQQAIDLDPTTWLAYVLWAQSLASAGDIDAALTLLEQGQDAVPDGLALQAMTARLRGGGASASPPEDYQEALGAAREALAERRWDDAVSAAQQATTAAPGAYEARLALGDAYRGMSELSQATAAYVRAVELAPQISFLHGRLAEMLARAGRSQEAISVGLTAISIDQSRWENWYALGRAYASQVADEIAASSDLAGSDSARLAEATLERAQALAPSQSTAPARSLADLRAVLDAHLARATQAAPTEPAEAEASQSLPARRARAEQLLADGQSEQALAIFQELAATNPEDRASRMGKANALAALGRVDEALTEFEAISAQWPDFPFSRIRQGTILEEQGDQAGALAVFEEAVAVAPDNANTHFTLAYALRRAGRVPDAIAAFEAGLALDPNRSAAQQALDALKSGQP